MNRGAERMLARLVDLEKTETSGIESRHKYLEMHTQRFAEILRVCRTFVPDSEARILDVGRSDLTAFLASYYKDLQSLGLDLNLDDGGHRETLQLNVPHITFDLLNSQNVADWAECGPFDLIVFSEVIEHLQVAPAYVLAFLGSLLAPRGLLLCTTPNATGIGKRIRVLSGRNPYEQLRLYSRNPGHIREYTKQELVGIGATVGLRCISHFYCHWFRSTRRSSMKRAAIRLLYAYPALRPFQVFVFGRKEDDTNGT